jgi:hypothetical protein
MIPKKTTKTTSPTSTCDDLNHQLTAAERQLV